MRQGQAFKVSTMIKAQSAPVSGADFTCSSVDTTGFEDVTVVFHVGDTDTALTVLKLVESNDDSTWTDVTGGDYSSSLPAATDDGKTWAWRLLTAAHKRYLSIVATVDTAYAGDPEAIPDPIPADLGATATAFAILSGAQQAPDTATERGLNYEATV